MYSAHMVELQRGSTMSISDGWGSQGNQSEIMVNFTMPSAAATFGIIIVTASATSAESSATFEYNASLSIAFAFDPLAFTANMTVQPLRNPSCAHLNCNKMSSNS